MKLIPTKEELRDGWDAPLHFSPTFVILIYHLVVSLTMLLLLNFVGVILFKEHLWGTSLEGSSYILTFLTVLFLELIFYKRMYSQAFYQYCKSLLILAPVYLAMMLFVYIALG